jgi:hypothetical protein
MRTVLLALCLLVPLVVVAQDEAELLQNPGFDLDENKDNLPDGWSCSDKQVRRQEIQAFGGNYELVSLPGTYVLATQDLTLKPGQQYNLTLRIRGEGGALGGALVLHGPTRPQREFSIVWNIEVGAQYENYVATFKAPDPACRLYLYNVSRQGTIYYDHVSLREGSPDQLIVQQLSLAKIDRPLEEPPVTAHIPYGRPLLGGPLRACITLRSFRHLREVTELAQRIELDYDVLSTGYEGDEAVSETGRRMMQRLADDYYEVYLVPSRVGPAALKTIKERVEKGAGLVVMEGFGQAGKFLDTKTMTEVPAEHYLRRGVPWEVMPQGIMTGMQMGQLGQGRVVRMSFPYTTCRVWGLIPIGLEHTDWIGRQWAYWDGWLSLLSKAMLWAARGEPQAKAASAQVIYRSARELRFDGPDLRVGHSVRERRVGGPGDWPPYAVPAELPAGPVLAEVMLRDSAGRTVDWATRIINTPQQARIVELQAESPTVKPGEQVKLTVVLSAPQAVGATVEGRLIDAFGRDVALRSVPQELAAGEQAISLTLPLAHPLCVHHKAFVRVLVGGKEQDSRWVPVRVPEMGPRLAMADFVATPWGPGGFPAALALLANRTRELGINGEFGVNQYVAGEHGMLAAGYSGGGGAFRESSHPGDVRAMCLSDPAVVAKYTSQAKEVAAQQAPEGPYAVGITDEAFLSYHNQRQELCFSPFCVARFRKWLQARVPSLEALNVQWGTSYQAWEEVRGAKTEEIRGQQNFGRFVDFRTFMTDVWVDACQTITDAYHEVNPTIPMGHTNTFGCNPFNGNDYWKLATQTGFGWGQEYSEAIKGGGNKAIFDLWQSFVETPEARASHPAQTTPFFNHGWIGYNRSEVAAHYEPWWLALHDSRGVSYFATSAYDVPRGRSWALVYPTGCLTEYSGAVKTALADLRGGVGKLLMEYRRQPPQVAILWSHPSMLVAWCESSEDVSGDPLERDTSDAYASWYLSAYNFRQHLNELQLDYQYVAPEQILKTEVLKGYPMLILPFTIAASETLVQRLEQYVEQGGVIVGDMRCLRTDEHGKPDATDSLKRLFGVTRMGAVDYRESKVAFKNAGEGIDLTGREMTVHGQEGLTVVGATALAAQATGEPAVLVLPRGKGLAVYLNFKLPQYDVQMRELLRQIVARAGVRREVTVETAGGVPAPALQMPPRAWELNTFRRGAITVHGFIRDFRKCEDTDPVTIDFGRKAHVYDVRGRRYLGQVDRVPATLPPGETALYALLPYRVSGLTVKAPATVKAGEELVAQVALLASGKAGDHVVRVEVVDPRGQSVWCYARHELLPAGGPAGLRVPTALNDAKGKWTLRVRDVLTGTEGAASFVVQ